MKLYMRDNTRKLKKIKNELEKEFVIEAKESLGFKMTKNDYVILSDEVGTLEGLEKLKNIIILVTEKKDTYIWHLVNDYKTVDVIDEKQDEKYICERIKRRVGNSI